MTHLVLEPDLRCISRRFPRASDSKVVRIRILAQVVNYSIENAILTVKRIPNLPTTSSATASLDSTSFLELNMHNLVSSLDQDSTERGGFVDVLGYFNGEEINLVSCLKISGEEFLEPGNISVIQKLEEIRKII